jgi:RNA polymerase sigma-70 factor (ECF subfamily)
MNPRRPQELATRLAQGDEHALGDLYDAYGSALYSLAFAMAGNESDAERIVTRVFEQTWRDASAGRPGGANLFAHLVALTRRVALQLRSTGARRSTWATRERDESREEGTLSTSRATVQGALGELTEKERTIVGLAFLGGRSVREIAADLRESESGVAQHLRSAMDGLRSALSPVTGTLEKQVVTRV